MHTQYLPKSSIYIHFDGSLVDQKCSTLREHRAPPTRLEWLATEFYDYTLSISLPLLNLKLCQQLKH